MKSLSVSLLAVLVSGLAGEKGASGPFFTFQGIQPVQPFDNKGFKAGIFYPISSFSNQVQFASQKLTNQIPEIDQSANQIQFLPANQVSETLPSTNQRQTLPEIDLSLNEIETGLRNQKLPFDHHPEELLSLKLIEKIKSQQRIPEQDVSPFLKRKMEELSIRKKSELSKPSRTNQIPAFSPAANENRPLPRVSNQRQFLAANQDTLQLANENKVPELKVDFKSGRYFFSY